MELVSEELPDGISVSLSVTGTGGNVLTGNLSGTYPIATYRISGDLTIASADTVILEAGTEFQFDGEYNFNIYGILKAVGTEEDSIIFDNFGEERWRGFILDGASDETEFQYVRISGAEKDDGGGMYLYSSNPTLTNVTISENIASAYGGGMYLEISQPTLNNVTIANNTAVYNGGGMRLHYSHPTLTHVTISGNTANSAGGMWLDYSDPTLTNVTIANNTANYLAGGMRLGSSHPILTNVTIANNTADEHGGALYLSYTSDPTLTNVTISGNTAGFSGGGMYLHTSDPTLTNSIIWDNSPESIYIDDNYSNLPPSTPTIIYSDIEGGWEGEGNIYLDPFFTDPENGYFTLQEGSPCIDAGTADLDGDDITDYCGTAPDMGAYEFYSESYDDQMGDFTGDGFINVLDIVALVENILSAGEYNPAGDLVEDGVLNVLDIVALVNIILGGGE